MDKIEKQKSDIKYVDTLSDFIKKNNEENSLPKSIAVVKIEKITTKNNKKIIIILSIIGIIIIIGLILIIGYFSFGWFQHKQENIVNLKREINQVLRYKLETKIKENYDFENEEVKSKTHEVFIYGDYIITINDKKKLSYFGEIDYKYNATILILNLTELNSSNNTGNYGSELGTNIYKNLVTNSTNPWTCKFIFYQNGTLGDIFLPKNMQQNYQIFMYNVINATIPKISKSLYSKEENLRNLYGKLENLNESYYKLNYENGTIKEATIHEKIYEKNLNILSTNSTIEGSESNKEKVSKFDGITDELVKVEMEGYIKLVSQSKENKRKLEDKEIINDDEKYNKTTIINDGNEEKNNFGYKGYEGIVNSNITLISNKNEKNTTEVVGNLASKYEYINYKDINKNEENIEDNQSTVKKRTSKIDEINEEYSSNNDSISDNVNTKRDLATRPKFNQGWNIKYTIVSGNILGINVQLIENLITDSSSNYRATYAQIKIGSYYYSFASLYSYYNTNNKETKTANIINREYSIKIFDFNIWIAKLSANIVFEIKATNNLYSYIQSNEMNAKAQLSSVITAKLTTTISILFFGGGAEFTGDFLNGNAYILLRTRNRYNEKYTDLLYGSDLRAIDIYIYFYTKYWYLFCWCWRKSIDAKLSIYSTPGYKRDYSSILK